MPKKAQPATLPHQRTEQAKSRGLLRTMVELPVDLVASLDRAARKAEISRAAMIRKGLASYLGVTPSRVPKQKLAKTRPVETEDAEARDDKTIDMFA